ncbi:response regulator transcription factor [Diaminobutyricimonas sp. LJ205]|uniref:response regulator transcription factor n=1 Tax=Diaminobutyricimonas sp. LJ205 TaxID=2683590 RepID=UPI0012F4BACD|nr:response regulator transcription factor [Diaminobutyricimonas sp. LJ205]
MTIRVLVVDDQELVRSGFRLILERHGFEVVGEAGDGIEAVELAASRHPDVVLMDIRMPRMDGIEATTLLTSQPEPRPRVLALTTFDVDEYVYKAVRAGASGFLLKDVSPDDLVHAVGAVARGDTMLASSVTRRLLERFSPRIESPQVAELTDREVAVARLVARGLTNADVGRELFLSEATVKTYVSRLLAKLELRDRVQLAVFAYESGLVQVGEPADQ